MSYSGNLNLVTLLKTLFMKKNMGNADRVIRMLVVIAIVVLFAANIITGTLAIVLLVLAGIFFLTSFLGFCPLYTIFGINTCQRKLNNP